MTAGRAPCPRLILIPSLTLALTTGAAACGGGGKDDGDGEAFLAAPERIAEAVCPKAYECCLTDHLLQNPAAGTDVATCKQATSEGFRLSFEALRDSQRRGRASFDQTKLDACLVTIASSTCEQLGSTKYLSGVPGCGSVAIPKVAAGGACLANHDCVGGYCQGLNGPDGEGTCAVLETACDSWGAAGCPDDMVCNSGLCSSRLPTGGNCRFDEECQSNNCLLGTSGCSATAERCFYNWPCSFANSSPQLCSVW
jgi:hypothetical protein